MSKDITKYRMSVTVGERDDFNGRYTRRGKIVKVVHADTIDECWEQIERMLADGERPDKTDQSLRSG